jgi:hypothetical protein
VITRILHKPVTIAQQVVGSVARGGLHGAIAVARRILPGDDETPTVTTEPVRQPPSPKLTPVPTKKAPAKKTAAKKAPAKKTTAKKTTAKKAPVKTTAPKPRKPAATLDEGPAPVDNDPVVYSTGPDVATNVAKGDLDDLRP